LPEAKNVLVTGGAGFIGSALIRQLLKLTEHSICNLDKLTYAANPAALTEVQHKNKYQFYKIDITNSEDVQNIIFKFQPDIIYHLAAETHVDRSIDSSDAFMLTNVLGTHNLLKASLAYWESLSETKAIKFRFHHISTDEVYGDLGKHGGVFKEESPYHPSSPYSASKASSDHLVRAWYRTYGLPILITNCSNNYGPFQHCEKLIPKVITNVIRGEEIPVYGNGQQIRDWLYVDDHADALILIAEKATVGSTYNISGNNTFSNLQVIEKICELLEKEIPKEHRGYAQFDELIRFIEDRPGHDIKYALDAQKLETELHWKPKESFENGLEKTVKWFVAQSDLKLNS
jgi:dTDP-glucose 4,6-dehydratase